MKRMIYAFLHSWAALRKTGEVEKSPHMGKKRNGTQIAIWGGQRIGL